MGTVSYIPKENTLYQACPSANCNKKVIDNGDGNYTCEKCSQQYPNFEWRLMMSFSMCDATGQVWATAFQVGGPVSHVDLHLLDTQLHSPILYQPVAFSRYSALGRCHHNSRCHGAADGRVQDQRPGKVRCHYLECSL
jgi:hypothetical protein